MMSVYDYMIRSVVERIRGQDELPSVACGQVLAVDELIGFLGWMNV